MSKIKEFENIPEIDIDGAETLEEAVEDCKALYAKFDKELDGTESTPLARCNEARLLLLTLAHRSHHVIEYATAALKAQLLPTSTGTNLDNLAALVGTERLQAGCATTVLRFTLSAERTSVTSIPEGVQVRTADKRYFYTSEYAEIPAGELTVDVPAVAADAGADSTSIAAGEVNVLVDPIPYVASVTNVSATSGGTETESDDSLTERAYLAPSNTSVAGPPDLYEYFTKSWRSDISDTKIICKDGYTIYIYFLLADGRLPTAEECRELERYFAEVKKPMGDLVVGTPPAEVPYNIELTYYIASSNTKKASTIQANVKQAVADYQTWQRKIGRDIDPAELIMRVREAGAKRPKLTAPADTKVSEIQVAKMASCNIVYGGIEDD